MLTDVINGIDINGENDTRMKFVNTVATFKVDKRLFTREYKFEHHKVINLHGKRYLACVKRGALAMLVEADASADKIIVCAEMDSSIYSDALVEALAQIKMHVFLTRKPTKKAEAVA